MTKIAYIQPIGGASGDMLLGALVDAGLPLELLRRELAKLPVDGYALAAAEETRCEIRGTHLKVHLEDRTRYSPAVLLRTVETSPLNLVVKEQASEVLRTLWKAEARVHGEPEEALELEELGSVDTLVDVVGFCVGLRELGVDEVYAAPLVLGEPSPPRRPGGYSNPAPATLELIAASGAPVAADSPAHAGAGELTTPTGAALITTLSQFRRPAFSVQKVGVGLGTKDPPGFPNALRVWLGETADAPTSEEGKPDIFQPASVLLLETNLDDAPGLVLGYAQERLFALGALDVWQPDITWRGGISAGLRILDIANKAGVPVVPHRGGEPWGLHFIAGSGCHQLAEMVMGARDAPKDVVWLDAPEVADGRLQLTDEPGFGVRLNEAML